MADPTPVLLFGKDLDPDVVGAVGWVGRDNIQTGCTGGVEFNTMGRKRVLNVALIPGQAIYSDDTTSG